MKKFAFIIGMGWMSLSVANAQQDTTLVRTVVVENQYNPTVMDASKINVLPKVEEPTVPKAHIDYASSIRPVSAWNYKAMQPIVKEWNADAAYRGYLRGGYGNNGNVDAALGYLWDISKKDRLNVAASLDGWNGELPLNDSGRTSRFYRTQIGLDYKHSFKKIDFLLGGNYGSQVFNYIGESDKFSNKQHQTLANAYLGFASNDKDMPVQFEAEVGMKTFGEKYPVMYHDEKNKETNLYLKGDVWKQSSNDARFGLKVNVDNYSYASDYPEGWTAIEGNPYITTLNDDWKVRVGAHVDWKGGEDSKVYVSPDVSVEYTFSDSYVLFAKAEGGRQTSSFYELAHMTPFFYESYIKPTYMTLDAALGLKASPMNGWWFLLSGGYQIRENDVCLELGQGYPFWHARNTYGKTDVFYGTAELKYDYKDLLDFSLKGTYYHWNYKNTDWYGGDPSEYALSLKPELELGAEVGAKVMPGLRVHAGYEYVKRCTDKAGDPVNNLHVGADYAILKNLNVFAKFNNLLNQEYIRPDAYPAQKLNFIAGLSLQF